VIIHGNVIGYNSGATRTMQYRIATITNSGTIISNTGDIGIDGHANNAHLEARNGTIRLQRDITHSTLIAKRIEILNDTNIFDCTIIAEEIIIRGKIINCHIIAERYINGAKSIEK
jgi:hypothetical protein